MKSKTLDQRLSARDTAIAVVAILLFLAVAFSVAVIAHQTHLKNQQVKIDGFQPVYVYSETATEVRLSDILTLPGGVHFAVKKVTDKDGNALPSTTTFDVREKQVYFVFLEVFNEDKTRVHNYALVLTSDPTEKGFTPPEEAENPAEPQLTQA